MTVWGVHAINQQSITHPFEQKERQPSISSAETLPVRNVGQRGSTKKCSDGAPRSSPSLGITIESMDGEEITSNEFEPRAVIVSRFPLSNSSEACATAQEPEFFDNMRVMTDGDNMISQKTDSNQSWSAPPRRCGEETETASFNGVRQEEFPKPDLYRRADSAEAIRALAGATPERASRQEDANCSDIVWTAWGCKDQKDRRSVLCFILLFLSTLAVTGFLLGLFLVDKTTRTAAIAQSTTDSDDRYDWVGDRPENTPPAAMPQAAPAFPETAPSQPPVPLTNRPTDDPVADPPRPTTPPVSRAEIPIYSPTPSPGETATNYARNATAHPDETTTPTRNPEASPVAEVTEMPVFITSRPTRLPTQETRTPTDEPSTCESILVVDNFCYVDDEDNILVDFINCDPQDDDWVGIWLASEDPDNLSGNSYAWAWSCGSQNCDGAPTTNRIAFETSRLGFETFRAFLVNETPQNQSYVSHAMSEPFTVQRNCSR